MQHTLFPEKMESNFLLTNSHILLLNLLYESIYCISRSRTFHILMQLGKNDDPKGLVLQFCS